MVDVSLRILYASVVVEGIDRLLHIVLRPDLLSHQARPLHHLGVGGGSQDCFGEPLDQLWTLDINAPRVTSTSGRRAIASARRV
jgi:hypothetical protein